MKKEMVKIFGIFVLAFALMFPLVSAGVGIKWTQESMLVPEKTESCITYFVYNPYSGDAYAKVYPSEEFDGIIVSSESEIKFIPENTPSSESIPMTFCFKTPRIYERDCLIGDSLICKQECAEEMKVFEGQMIASEVTNPDLGGSSQGSATQMSITAPMRLRVQCIPHDRNYSFIYIVVASIALILLALSFIKKKKPAKGKKK